MGETLVRPLDNVLLLILDYSLSIEEEKNFGKTGAETMVKALILMVIIEKIAFESLDENVQSFWVNS